MAENKKTPKIRFKGFTEDWEECELNILADRYDNLRVPITAIYRKSGSTPYYGANGLQDYVKGYTHNGEYILIAEDGANDLKNYPVQYVKGKIWANNHTHVLQAKKKIADNKFLKYAISQTNIEPYLVGGGRAKLNAETMMKIGISVPLKIQEQEQNGSYFMQLDNLITLHQRKYDKLQNIKKACLEKMFPKNGADVPEIRFKGFIDPWQQRKLANEVILFGGLTYSPSNVVKENGTLVLRSSNVKNGEIVNADNVYVDSNIVNSSNVKDGDVIVVVRNGSRSLIGKHAQIKGDMNNTVIGAFMTGIRSKQSAFINALLNTQAFDSEVEKNLGATINQITSGMFQQMKFMFPKSEEQTQIGEFFKHLDNLITLQECELTKLQNIKKSCLEKMFV